jgi:hypothetical protein
MEYSDRAGKERGKKRAERLNPYSAGWNILTSLIYTGKNTKKSLNPYSAGWNILTD